MKNRKNVGGIGRDFGGTASTFGAIPRNFDGMVWTQLLLQICTAHENHMTAELKIDGIFFWFSADFVAFCDSRAGMSFRQKFLKMIFQYINTAFRTSRLVLCNQVALHLPIHSAFLWDVVRALYIVGRNYRSNCRNYRRSLLLYEMDVPIEPSNFQGPKLGIASI